MVNVTGARGEGEEVKLSEVVKKSKTSRTNVAGERRSLDWD
jgi:hypothetical protein